MTVRKLLENKGYATSKNDVNLELLYNKGYIVHSMKYSNSLKINV